MAPSTQFRNPAVGLGNALVVPVAAETMIYGGTIVAIDSAGDGAPASDAADVLVAGVAQGDVDNSRGEAGDAVCPCDRRAVEMNNSVSDPVTKADLLQTVFVEDDHTINRAGGSHKVKAGILIGINADGSLVAVDFGLASVAPGRNVVESSSGSGSESGS